MVRIAAGFLVAPAIALLVLGIVLSSADGRLTAAVAMLGAVVAYPSAILFGLPIFLLLMKRNHLNLSALVLAALLAAVPGFVLLFVLGSPDSFKDFLETLAAVGSVSAVSGVIFWFIAVYRNDALTSVRADAQKAARRSTSR